MPRQRIDLTSIFPVGGSARQQRARIWQSLTVAEWKRQIKNHPRVTSTKAAMLAGVRAGRLTATGAEVELVGMVPNIVEQGLGPEGVGSRGSYDARQFVLKQGTQNLHGEPGSFYVHVPFHHSGEGVAALGGAAAAKEARSLAPTTSQPLAPSAGPYGPIQGYKTAWGGRLGPGYHPRLTGMVRMTSTYSTAAHGPGGGGGGSTYRTWRTMSQKGKPWITPGVEPRDTASRVQAEQSRILDMVF